MNNKIKTYKVDLQLDICANATDKIAKIDILIDSLFNTATETILKGGVAEYKINTGQTIQEVKYRSVEEITKAIDGFRLLRKQYENDVIPRVVKLVDGKAFGRR